MEVMLCRPSLLRSPLMSGRPREIMYQCTCQCRVVLRFTQAAFEKRLLRKNSESGPLRGATLPQRSRSSCRSAGGRRLGAASGGGGDDHAGCRSKELLFRSPR